MKELFDLEYRGFEKFHGNKNQLTCLVDEKYLVDFLKFTKELKIPHSNFSFEILFNPRVRYFGDKKFAVGFWPTFEGVKDTTENDIRKILAQFGIKHGLRVNVNSR